MCAVVLTGKGKVCGSESIVVRATSVQLIFKVASRRVDAWWRKWEKMETRCHGHRLLGTANDVHALESS
jgi:hypothetical protein